MGRGKSRKTVKVKTLRGRSRRAERAKTSRKISKKTYNYNYN